MFVINKENIHGKSGREYKTIFKQEESVEIITIVGLVNNIQELY